MELGAKGEIVKVKPPSDYPPEEGRYVRGNDYSPVAVCVILDTFDFAIPMELEDLVMEALDAGAALSGMLQRENIGIEKLICNIVSNPNIRYLIVCGREAYGHLPGETLRNLIENGIDENGWIIGARALTPYLPNIPKEAIERFRRQIKLIDLVGCLDPERVKAAVRACYQEKPTRFENYVLYDPGAYPDDPICVKLRMKINKPWEVERPKTVSRWRRFIVDPE
ncbi:MAG TPA: tetrahydromethanopterin S-methyltransferase subunit A [Candidatus Syntrophoarchaeum butanivorans]|uniref:Tetrahydromethanopterin S-methyltransferase subunit A n=1 Tax=Candidatus Syntropharchaeum butanivorans TaxID=1839936 RepID=A0A1F2P5I4_9EURY|nr:MAG: tetrahydromethanopterin S-methyltransferase subunit A [Candidatus Syntrophoarchaeum butanivorans]HEC56667.1 tetrahydromethanopterin S-methyltransferase subunit A [Candidatus Syntrophoarchaeum butanivorans]